MISSEHLGQGPLKAVAEGGTLKAIPQAGQWKWITSAIKKSRAISLPWIRFPVESAQPGNTRISTSVQACGEAKCAIWCSKEECIKRRTPKPSSLG